jgi:hypothetical protein
LIPIKVSAPRLRDDAAMKCRAALCSVSLLVALSASAAEEEVAAPAPEKPGRLFVHATMGFNMYQYLGSTATAQAAEMTPSNRMTILQQVGFGYWVHPLLRLQLTAMFAETLSGMPAGASAFTLASLQALACFTWKGALAGAGLLVAPRAYGNWGANGGLTAVLGYGVPLGAGFGLSFVVQMPVLLVQRFSLTLAPALILGYRF